MRAVDSALNRFQCAPDLGQHAAVDGAVGDQAIDLFGGQSGQDFALFIHQAGDVGQQNQFFGLEGLGDFACNQVGVDVVRLTVRANADGRDHRNKVAFDQHVQQVGVNPDHFTDLADINDFRLGHVWRLPGDRELSRANQFSVFAGQANGAAAVAVDQVDDVLVDLAAQDHFHHVHGLCVSDAHAVDEVAFDGQALEQVADLRAPAVNHYRVDTDGFHQHDIARKAGFQLLALHSVAAVFDHQRLADKSANVRQRFGQNFGYISSGIVFEGHSGLQ